jgi:nitroreductase
VVTEPLPETTDSLRRRESATCETLAVIHARRSVSMLGEPGPSADELEVILAAAAAAPDHKELRPWRFVVVEGEARRELGEILADALAKRLAAAGQVATTGQLDKERRKPLRAPTLVGVLCVPDTSGRVPLVEQLSSTAAAAQNALLAATALGLGSMWRTGSAATDESVRQALGVGPEDTVVGWLYLGTPRGPGHKPPRSIDLDGLVRRWQPRGSGSIGDRARHEPARRC